MTTSQLAINRIVNVTVSLTPAGAQAQSLSNLLVLGTSAILDTVERFRVYQTLAQVAADFGTSAQEYLAAQAWFGQTPQPTTLYIGRWCQAAASGGLRCATISAAQQVLTLWTAITSGGFQYTPNGGTNVSITGLNFSGALSLSGVAAIIQAALTGVNVVWNSVFSRFEFTSATTGVTSSVSFLTAAASGTDISAMLAGRVTSSGAYTFVGLAAETSVAAVTLFDQTLGQQWYGLFVPSAADSDHLLIAPYIDGATNKHIYGITTNEAGVLVATSTTDIAYVLQQLNYQRTLVQYSSSNSYAVVSAMARIMTVNYGGSNTVITLKFKQEPGVVAETLNLTQVSALEAKNCNVFVTYNNNTSILEQGVMVNGSFVDIITGTDWLAVTIQTAIYNLLYTSTTKIPQTDAGMQLLTTQVDAICAQAVINGLLAPGVWNSGGFGKLNQGDYMSKGYYIWCDVVANQLQSSRTQRLAMPIQVAAKLAGAIHSANIAINVNQ